MGITKKFDRAFQWAGEKMGHEAKTTMSDDFKLLETEMGLRYDGLDRLQKSMSTYVKWLGRRGDTFDDGEKGVPAAYLGRTMVSHGEDFDHDSEFGNCLVALGRGNERVAAMQETFVADATSTWLESLERSLATMKEYQAARKKLESRRLAYDASMTKVQKNKREDFRLEEELRSAKAKYEESSEDVLRRMQDIKDAEGDGVRDLSSFLDAELDYHERCAEELRRVRENWAGTSDWSGGGARGGLNRRPTVIRTRSNTSQSYGNDAWPRKATHSVYEDTPELAAQPVRMPTRSFSSRAVTSPVRPTSMRQSSFQSNGASFDRTPSFRAPNVNSHKNRSSPSALDVNNLRGQLRPVSHVLTRDDVFGDGDDDTASSSGGSPDWSGERSASPATSLGSFTRSSVSGQAGVGGYRKAPPPPPPSRAKKPPPPIPAKRNNIGV